MEICKYIPGLISGMEDRNQTDVMYINIDSKGKITITDTLFILFVGLIMVYIFQSKK